MKKIDITIICTGERDYPRCADIVAACPQFNIVSHALGLYESGLDDVLAKTDVVLLNQAVIENDGSDALRSMCAAHPMLRVLLILEQVNERNALDSIFLGASGVIEHNSMRLMLPKAIPTIYSGEYWISRDLVPSLRREAGRRSDDPYLSASSGGTVFRNRIN